MSGSNGQTPAPPVQFQIQPQMVQAVLQMSAASGVEANEMLNVLLVLGKLAFDSSLITAPFISAIIERNKRIGELEPDKDLPADEEDPLTPEQRLEENRRIARGEEPSTPPAAAPPPPDSPPATGTSEDKEEEKPS